MSKVSPEFKHLRYAFTCEHCKEPAISTARGIVSVRSSLGYGWAYKLFCPACKKLSTVDFHNARKVE